ncbi:MAG: trigger factor [Flavobacteriaceae bacterium]|nr:trigger factor [Flavobacteriaceae bacterium]
MQISRKDTDSLNSIITITVDRNDFVSKVDDVLKNYRKTANVPGFRKGYVPMSMIKKQYENAVIAEEVNKILKENLDKYLKDEKIDILGNPIPIMNNNLDWKSDSIDFSFELGLSPKFEIDLKTRKKVTYYHILADDKMINEQLNNFQKQYGKIIAKKEVKKEYEITASFDSKENKIETTSSFTIDDIKGKKNKDLILRSKPGASITLECNNLFDETNKAHQFLGISKEAVSNLKGEIIIEIKEVNERILADLNQELFDKIYKPGTVKSEKELKLKIADGIEKQLEQQSEQKLLNDVTDFLIKNTKFELPEKFLVKWMQNSGKEPLTIDRAEEEYIKSEKGIRYQLIEGKIVAENDLQVKIEELKEFAKDMITRQMAQYGQPAPGEKEMEGIISRILSNQEEGRRLQEQLMSKKLLKFYKENAPLKVKKINFESFVKEAYAKA